MKNIAGKILAIVVAFFQLLAANAANYYWVGGSGNWSEFATHWAKSSGGTIFHTQVPTSADNVYFDAYSFTGAGQTVMLDTTIVYCRDMDWTGAPGNPTLTASNTSIQLKVFGSLTLNPSMNFTFNGTLIFTALTTGKTIATFGKSLPCTIDFNGAGGEWTMLDSLTTSKGIVLTYGTLRTNDNNLKCLSFNSDNNNARALFLGTSVVFTTASNGYGGWSVSSSLVSDADSSIIKLRDRSAFYSEGQTYNVVQWDSTGNDIGYLESNDDRIKKVISFNSYPYAALRIQGISTQIDSIIVKSNLVLEYSSSNNHFKFVYTDGNIRTDSHSDSIYTMIAGGDLDVEGSYDYNYISNATVNGDLTIRTRFNTFDTCTVYGNVTFLSDNNDLGILTVTQGKTLTFGANKTQIIDSFIPLSDPGFPIQLVSSDLGDTANVVINSSLCADYLYIHGIHASGSNALYAGNNSDDVANNAGWIFAPCAPTGCSAYFELFPDTVPSQYYAVNMASGIPPLSYLWSWGDSTFDTIAFPTHLYSDTGFYVICLTVTDSAGCADTYCDSFHLQRRMPMVQVNVVAALPCLLNVAAVPEYSSIMQGESVQIDAVVDNPGVVSYQWTPAAGLACSDCASVTATPDVSTTYKLVVMDINGCSDSAFVEIVVLPAGVNHVVLNNLSLYPNPSSGTVILRGMPSLEEIASLSLKLFDAMGRQVWHELPESGELSKGVVIDLNEINEGIYFLSVSTENGNRVMKVVRY